MQFQKGDGFRRRVFLAIEFRNQFAELLVDRVHGGAQAREFGAGLCLFDCKVRNLEFAFGKHLRVTEGGAGTNGCAAERDGIRFWSGFSARSDFGAGVNCFFFRYVGRRGRGNVVEQFVHHSSSPNFD